MQKSYGLIFKNPEIESGLTDRENRNTLLTFENFCILFSWKLLKILFFVFQTKVNDINITMTKLIGVLKQKFFLEGMYI